TQPTKVPKNPSFCKPITCETSLDVTNAIIYVKPQVQI
ncbi:MAG: hypothetical protein ACI9Z4_002425, partial [Polaribacter sp.]